MTKAYNELPPASELWEKFEFQPLTGSLIRKTTGKEIGRRHPSGYIYVGVNRKIYLAHRLILAWCTGYVDSKKDVDHINMDKTDNRYWNLRQLTRVENCWNNDKANRNSKTGMRGISRTQNGGYCVKVTGNGVTKKKICRTIEEAKEKRLEFLQKLQKI